MGVVSGASACWLTVDRAYCVGIITNQVTRNICSCAEDPFSCATIPSTLPEDLPHLDPDKLVARRNAAELTAAEFKRLYWKTDTPVIITGVLLLGDYCLTTPLLM